MIKNNSTDNKRIKSLVVYKDTNIFKFVKGRIRNKWVDREQHTRYYTVNQAINKVIHKQKSGVSILNFPPYPGQYATSLLLHS